MDLHVVHFVVVAGWFGVLGAEFVLELLPLRLPELRRATVVFHYHIDLFLELPLILAVLVTGVLLLVGRPVDGRLAIKLAGSALALAANLACIAVVILRYHGLPDQVDRRSRHVYVTAGIGIPGGIVALYLGLSYAGWLG